MKRTAIDARLQFRVRAVHPGAHWTAVCGSTFSFGCVPHAAQRNSGIAAARSDTVGGVQGNDEPAVVVGEADSLDGGGRVGHMCGGTRARWSLKGGACSWGCHCGCGSWHA
ncbi:hypothetical protein CVCC1112_216 [Paenarthrobacter nicotinovorans]|nr:hypothetical protein ANMWB30_34040 [Arthrobacter sp. MWB30]GAT85556.1 hypothetical protein CVCC1112_216 [Paenarthrobacter nicotinovorans]